MESSHIGLNEARQALVTTECRNIATGFETLGLRTHEARFDNVDQPSVPRIAEGFLLASRNRRHDRDTQLSVTHYFTDSVTVALSQIGKEASEAARVPLPQGSDTEISLAEAVAMRRSVRDFADRALGFDDLATMMRYGNSETAEVDADLESGEKVTLRLRTVASGGGLFPVEMLFAARSVAGLDGGIYRYLPHEDALVQHGGPGMVDEAITAGMQGGGADLREAAGFFIFVAQPWRSMRKYGPRGMRFVFHEAGAISQNLHLAATGLGLGSLDSSSFYDDDLDSALGLDGLFRTAIHLIAVGHPAR